MPVLNNRGFSPIIIVIILLFLGGAILIGVNLTREKQDLKSNASETLVQDGEYGSTPINEILTMKRPENGIKLWPGQMLILYNPALLDFIATHYEYVHLESDEKEVINFLHNKNPDIKIIAAVGGVAQMIPAYEPYKYLTESDFLHAKSKPDKRILLQANEVLNIGSPQTRQNVVSAMNKILAETPGLDGLLFDGYHPWAGSLTEECVESADCNKQRWFDPATRNSDYWYTGYKAFNRLARDLINKDKELFFNGFNPSWEKNGDVGTAFNGWAADFNGAYIEHFEYAYIKPEYFRKSLKAIKEMVDNGKKILFNGEPGLLLGSNNGVIPPRTLDLQRFFLASFLLINNNQTTYYGYVPGEPEPTDITNVYFYKDWYLDFGDPLDIYRNNENPNVYYRLYTNGIAVINASGSPQKFIFPSGYGKVQEWMEGPAVGGRVVVPAKSGRFYSKISYKAPVVSVENLCSNSQTEVKVTWTNYAAATGYRVYRNNQLIETVPADTLLFTDTTASGNTEYSYWIAAEGGDLGEANSNTVIARPKSCSPNPTTACNGPYCLNLKQSGCNGNVPYYLLEWTASTRPDFSYYLLMKNNAQIGGTITPVSQNSMWTNADSDSSHSYYIRARSSDGSEAHTGTLLLNNKCLQN